MRALMMLGGALALAGCVSSMPDSGPEARRDAELRGQPIVPPSAQGVMPGTNPSPPGAPLNATGTAMPGSTNALSAPSIDASGTIGNDPSIPAPAMPGDGSSANANPDATIGADAMAALQQTAPGGDSVDTMNLASTGSSSTASSSMATTPVPQQPISDSDRSGPNLAAYALSVTNRPGQSIYKRGGLHLTSSSNACAKYVSADQAQLAFLAAGGPQRDRLNLDPDGDGFACNWDPTPFQTARQ
ncbi:hypothetical protein FGG78_12700 [Thioclava sp. BHET1]|nr:hypothetical protein FGG78_12700 [Thioclava sp. BHET1]